jgi:hypothetical protein
MSSGSVWAWVDTVAKGPAKNRASNIKCKPRTWVKKGFFIVSVLSIAF